MHHQQGAPSVYELIALLSFTTPTPSHKLTTNNSFMATTMMENAEDETALPEVAEIEPDPEPSTTEEKMDESSSRRSSLVEEQTDSLGGLSIFSTSRPSLTASEFSFLRRVSWANGTGAPARQGRRRRSSAQQRVTSFVQNVRCQHTLEPSSAKDVRDGIAVVFMFLVIMTYFLIKRGVQAYASPLEWDLPTCVTAVVLIAGTSRLSDASTYGERVLLGMISFIIFVVATCVMFAVTSPCTHCLYMSASSAVESPSDFGMIQPGLDKWKVWNILLSPDDGDDAMTVACRMCVSNVMTLFIFGGWNGYVSKRLGLSGSEDNSDIQKRVVEEMQVDHKSVKEDIGDLAAWYVHYENETKEEDIKRFKKKIAERLEKHGYIFGEDLADSMKDYLCSPSSRFDKPDPVKFLADIRNSRFTGETNLSNMSTSSLQKIMRGDVLKELGVSICFMLRFALSIPKDHSIEFKPVSHTHFAPMAGEQQMKSIDISTHLPGVVIPQVDQDIDPDGKDILAFKKVMLLFTQFPFEDDPIYFDTKEEYLAFYRWELVSTTVDHAFATLQFGHTAQGKSLILYFLLAV